MAAAMASKRLARATRISRNKAHFYISQKKESRIVMLRAIRPYDVTNCTLFAEAPNHLTISSLWMRLAETTIHH